LIERRIKNKMEQTQKAERKPRVYHVVQTRFGPNWCDGPSGSRSLMCYITEDEEYVELCNHKYDVGDGSNKLTNYEIEYLGRLVSTNHPFFSSIDSVVTEGQERPEDERNMGEEDRDKFDPQYGRFDTSTVYKISEKQRSNFEKVLKTLEEEGHQETNLGLFSLLSKRQR
jgi:hypothetical protein